MSNYLITFKNTHDAIKGESVVNKKSIKVKVMPTPTSITKSCGISLEINEEYIDDLKVLIENQEIKAKEIFLVKGNEYIAIDAL